MIFVFKTDTCLWIWCPIKDTISYKRLYEIKKRDENKLIAIIVKDIKELEKMAYISEKEKDFVLNYPYPFSVVLEKKYDFLDDKIINKHLYEKVSFRIAHTKQQKDLIEEFWPFFLTSLNESWEKEIYSTKEAKNKFGRFKEINFICNENEVIEKVPPSDIFTFRNWKAIYFRQNHKK